jgi:hypothetical protein
LAASLKVAYIGGLMSGENVEVLQEMAENQFVDRRVLFPGVTVVSGS